MIVLVESDEGVQRAREILDGAGAETVDAARESWQVGLTEPGAARGETAA